MQELVVAIKCRQSGVDAPAQGGRRSDEEWARRARPRDQQHNLLRIFSRYPTTTTTNNYLTALKVAGILRGTRNLILSPLPANSQTFCCRKARSYKLCANPSRYADICSFLSNELAVGTQYGPGGYGLFLTMALSCHLDGSANTIWRSTSPQRCAS